MSNRTIRTMYSPMTHTRRARLTSMWIFNLTTRQGKLSLTFNRISPKTFNHTNRNRMFSHTGETHSHTEGIPGPIRIRSRTAGTRSHMAETRSHMVETRSHMAGTRSHMAETRNHMAETRNHMAETRSRTGETRSPTVEIHSPMTPPEQGSRITRILTHIPQSRLGMRMTTITNIAHKTNNVHVPLLYANRKTSDVCQLISKSSS
ncbi:hypothetical protein MAR_012862 [Mya arenaria]|uniref:Uncharacterized protein n=1 Tax=Mya arenaria TaxID=6604 RepID=A0ABY7G221_MYAAR|nr:hypothetical protein MAR_012862 [Mya arenaria]